MNYEFSVSALPLGVGSIQTGRFQRLFAQESKNRLLGQGGFGRVYRCSHLEAGELRAVKVIPTKLRPGHRCEAKEDFGSNEVFERLQALRSPYILRYHDFWAEELDPFGDSTPSTGCTEPPVDAEGTEEKLSAPDSSFHLDDLSQLSLKSIEWAVEVSSSLTCVRTPQPFATILAGQQRPTEVSGVILVDMECCDGPSLHQWLYPRPARTQAPALSTSLHIFRQLLLGLADLHEVGIVHRDVKPGNLLLEGPDLHLRIIDFGLARIYEEGPPSPLGKPTGSLVGSPGYAAPEQHMSGALYAGAIAKPSADVFSAGVILLELLAASLSPFGTAMERAATIKALHGPRAEGQLTERLPAALEASPLKPLLLRLTDPEPQRRPTDREALEALDALEARPA